MTWSSLAGLRDSAVTYKPVFTDTVALHISAQNAGVLFHRSNVNQVTFEGYEASPKNTDVITAHDRLVRSFPGCAIALPYTVFADEHFRAALSAAFRQLDTEHVSTFIPTTRKAGSAVLETRDTTHPALVTEYLAGLLAALGQSTSFKPLQKCTRDDVLWCDTLLPWRRSPLWLVIRVALQLSLARLFPNHDLHMQYKSFVLYLICRVSDMARAVGLSSDLQQVIGMKVARRMYKLTIRTKEHGLAVFDFISESALAAVSSTRTTLENLWSDIREAEKAYMSTPHLDDRVADGSATLKLVNSKEYLQEVFSRNLPAAESVEFSPTPCSRMQFNEHGLPELGTWNDRSVLLQLAEFELWVHGRLGGWISSRTASPEDCSRLADIAAIHAQIAEREYKDCPREMSLAILIRVELWIAVDKICTRLYPLLEQYSPQIPVQFLNPLLLPRMEQMRRLSDIEQHLAMRHDSAHPKNPSIFADPTPDAFSVQFFNRSERHKRLKKSIEGEALKARAKKETEWRDKSAQFQSLRERAGNMSHYLEEDEWGDNHHVWEKCQKCKLESQAKKMNITPHEWPLPVTRAQLKSVCFELDRPAGFDTWRDMTWSILQDLGRSSGISGELPKMRLYDYPQLRSRAIKPTNRITLGSTSKSFLASHYSSCTFPVALSSVCVNNGLSYSLWDTRSYIWTAQQTEIPSIHGKCTFRLPSGPYSCLQYAVDSVSHTPNQVMARLADCPPELGPREYLEFGSLRAGERLQLVNIARELASGNLTFNSPSVYLLVSQAVWQAGTPQHKNTLRQSHAEFQKEHFCLKLLDVAERLVDTISANWKEHVTMATVLALVLRTLSLANKPAVVERTITLLRRIRRAVHRWCFELLNRLFEELPEESGQETRGLLFSAANMCRTTYDVDTQYLASLLHDYEDVATFVTSSILIHDNRPVGEAPDPASVKRTNLRANCITHALEHRLRLLISQQNKGLNAALSSLWSSINFKDPWKFLPNDTDHWAMNNTASHTPLPVHYNILSGQLLVGGNPLGRVPDMYEQDPMFRRIFGGVGLPASYWLHHANPSQRILYVFASDMSGMTYSTAQPINDHQVSSTKYAAASYPNGSKRVH